MIVIRLQGGLGNQMFQYALYLQLRAMGREVKIDEAGGYENDRQRRPVLQAIFGIDYEGASDRDVRRLRDSLMDPPHRVRRKLFGRNNREWEEPDGCFYPEVLAMDEVYFNGYFQSERYFPDANVCARLRREFSADIREDRWPGENLRAGMTGRGNFWRSKEAQTLAGRIGKSGERSVSLHIRRGDYLRPETAKRHGGICTERYYERAVRYADDRIEGAVYYIFSDDPVFARSFAEKREAERDGEKMGGEGCAGFVVVSLSDISGAERDAAELLLMSLCRHHILANSSFSWWGAWLGRRGDAEEAASGAGASGRLVLAPAKWFNNRAADAVYTDEMIKISGE